MWRMNYTIIANLYRIPKILETMHRMTDRRDLYSEEDCYNYVRDVPVKIMHKTGFIKTLSFGEENLPPEGGYVLCPNHQGKFDAYTLIEAHKRPMTAVMDREMSYFVIVNEVMEILQGKRLDLKDTRQALRVINQIAQEVAEGRRYTIFPEGGYDNSKHNKLWDFKPGCFKAATRAKAPIVPVAMVDSYKAYNSRTLAPVKIQVHFLEPLYYEDYKDLNTTQIGAIVKERIAEKLTELGCEV